MTIFVVAKKDVAIKVMLKHLFAVTAVKAFKGPAALNLALD